MTRADPQHSSVEWAFYLASSNVRGRGVGSQVELKVLEFAFGELGLHRLSCAVLAFNEPVVRMHESFGFVREGILRGAIWKDEGWTDVVLLGQQREEWEANRDQVRERLARPTSR